MERSGDAMAQPRDKQPPKNKNLAATRQQQHTGNHPRDEGETRRSYGADKFGGTRAGAENVEHGKKPLKH